METYTHQRREHGTSESTAGYEVEEYSNHVYGGIDKRHLISVQDAIGGEVVKKAAGSLRYMGRIQKQDKTIHMFTSYQNHEQLRERGDQAPFVAFIDERHLREIMANNDLHDVALSPNPDVEREQRLIQSAEALMRPLGRYELGSFVMYWNRDSTNIYAVDHSPTQEGGSYIQVFQQKIT
jgi:hypothetical protein